MPDGSAEPPRLSAVPPVGIALVICDNVYFDSTGKRALVGLFNRISAPTFPARHHKLCVFVSVTEVLRSTECKLDIVHAETELPILQMGGPMPERPPTTVFDMVFEVRELVFPEPGTYYVRFFGNEQILIQRPIEVVSSEHSEEQDNEHKH
jgi:hypothetical protein